MVYDFNAKVEKEHIINWIKEWFYQNGPASPAVIGISGGKDSTILAALLKEALGKERVIGVLMPNGKQSDINDSYRVVKSLDIPNIEINIENAYNSISAQVAEKLEKTLTSQTTTNLPPRLRMSTLYAVSQSVNGRVVNTTNLSEAYIGWGTRWGDCVGDFCPFKEYTCTEVLAIGDLCGLPEDLVHKKPSDGLCGQTDEDKFGFTYAELDNYIRYGIIPTTWEVETKIDSMHDRSKFKGSMPMSCKPTFVL